MPRKRRGPNWEGLVQAAGAIVLLIVASTMFPGSGRGRDPVQQEMAQIGVQAFHGLVGFLLLILFGIVAFAVLAAIIKYWVLKSSSKSIDEPIQHISWEPPSAITRIETRDTEAALDALDWHQLERLVGELFRVSGYLVEMRGGAHADGGIDLIATKDEVSMPVQCKQWKTWTCGVGIVREFLGAMKVGGFAQGYIVARDFSSDARDLAAAQGVALIDRRGLSDWVGSCLRSDCGSIERALYHPEKLCPKCGARMVQRTATKGRNAGNQFWGCSRYPNCKQILNL